MDTKSRGSAGKLVLSVEVFFFIYPLFLIPYRVSRIPYHLSFIPYHVSLITYHLSLITYPLSRVPYHISLTQTDLEEERRQNEEIMAQMKFVEDLLERMRKIESQVFVG